jgi:hypothetical protein
MSDAEGHDDSLALVDLIACALCCVLLMVFAALASRGGFEGTSTGFALVTLDWGFSGDPSEVDADANLDGRTLLTVGSGLITPGEKWFPDAGGSAGGRWSTPHQSIPAVSLFAELPKKTTHSWQVRLLIRIPGRAIQSNLKWTFRGPIRPTRVTARLIDQTTEGRSVDSQDGKDGVVMLSTADPLTVIVNVDMGTLSVVSK